MDTTTIKQTLFENGFTEKETELYLTSLQLGLAPISTIARHLHENRVTVYSTMKNLVTKGVAKSVTKSSTAYYSVISPQQLVEKISQKLHNLQSIVPDLLAITKKIDAPVKTQFFEGLEGLKTAYQQIITQGSEDISKDPFLTFVGTSIIDPHFQKWLEKDFIPRRMGFKKKTRAIITSLDSEYAKYNSKRHESIVINNPIFSFANEIVLYGQDQVAILMYASGEMAALITQSGTLHNALKSTFNLIWELHKAKKPTKRNLQKKPR